MDYGTGAVFGCPAHDQRDLDFARKYGLPVVNAFHLPGGTDSVGTEGAVCRRRPRPWSMMRISPG